MPDKSVSQASLSDVFQETPTFVSPAEEHDGEIDSANDSQCSSQPLGLTGAQIPETPPDPPPSYFAVSETPIRRGTGLSTEEDTEQSLGTAPDHTYVTEDIPDIVPCSSFALIKRMERLAQVNTKARPAEFKSQGEVHQWLKDVSSESEEKGIALGLLGANVSYLQRERYQGNCCSILAILATLLVTADFAEENSLLEAALSFVTIMHLASLFFLYRSEQRRVALWQRGSLLSGSNRSRLLWCVAEVLTVLTHRPMRTAVPRILNIVVFLRLFTLARSLRNMSFASSASSMLIGALCNTRMDVLFVYKTHLFKSPIKTMIITSGAGFVLLSLLTWFVEKTYGELNLAQCFWYTFVTATTVGYGDYTPASVGGKLVGMVSALYGIVVTAILVSVVQHKLTITGIQKQIILFLAEVRRVQQTKQKAARVVQESVLYNRMLQTVARSGRAIPKHRSYCKEVASGKTARLLYKMWMKLQEAVDEVRALRRESSTNWANISVLDVLHADPSDILAQNTVLQYLMQPADENLSMMLRVGKHNPMLARTKGDPRMAASDARSARSRSGEVSFKADPDPQVLESSCGTEDASLPSSAGAANRSVRSNSRDSMGSFRSFSSTVRTAATTNVLVDMLKLGVTGNSIVRRQSKAAGPHRLRRKPQQDVHSSDEEEDGATPPSTLSQHNLSMYRRGSNLDEECASPSHRKPNVSSFCASQPGLPSPTPFDMLLQNQRRMEAMLVQIAKEIGVTPRSPESVHDRIEPHIWVSPLQTRSHRSGSLVSSPQAADRLCVLPSNERPVDVGRSVERRPLSPDRLIGRLPSSGLAEAFEGRSPPKSDDRPSNLVVTDVTDNHSSIPCNQSYHSNSNSLNVPDPEKHEKRRMVQLDCPSPPASPLTDTGVSSPRKRPTTGRRDV